MPRPMTETERAQRHEEIVRDSYRQSIQNVRDWIRLLLALGETPANIDKLLTEFNDHVYALRNDLAQYGRGR